MVFKFKVEVKNTAMQNAAGNPIIIALEVDLLSDMPPLGPKSSESDAPSDSQAPISIQ